MYASTARLGRDKSQGVEGWVRVCVCVCACARICGCLDPAGRVCACVRRGVCPQHPDMRDKV